MSLCNGIFCTGIYMRSNFADDCFVHIAAVAPRWAPTAHSWPIPSRTPGLHGLRPFTPWYGTPPAGCQSWHGGAQCWSGTGPRRPLWPTASSRAVPRRARSAWLGRSRCTSDLTDTGKSKYKITTRGEASSLLSWQYSWPKGPHRPTNPCYRCEGWRRRRTATSSPAGFCCNACRRNL